jgi:DNA-binding winged helix-turn-helix (wHTH) protein
VLYRFAGFSVNSATRQLLEGDREVHLSPKAFELLILLIEQRSRAVSKTDLQDQLWPTTYVGETNLATLVAEIRRAVNDSAQESTVVRTIHRFGYRFVATIESDELHADAADSWPEMYLVTTDRRYRLEQGTALIGRAPDATIRIDSGGVSRHHARILVHGDEARIEDLGSKNGTFIDGQPVTSPSLLNDGTEVRIGPVALTFRAASAADVTETMTEPPTSV